jgi:hypothetical protein
MFSELQQNKITRGGRFVVKWFYNLLQMQNINKKEKKFRIQNFESEDKENA